MSFAVQERALPRVYVVSEDGIAADLEKIKCVNNWPTPTDQRNKNKYEAAHF